MPNFISNKPVIELSVKTSATWGSDEVEPCITKFNHTAAIYAAFAALISMYQTNSNIIMVLCQMLSHFVFVCFLFTLQVILKSC